MDLNRRAPKPSAAPRIETLEARDLLSVLINAKPTLEVLPQGNRVRASHGAISIVQPTAITVTGTAQPPAPNAQIVVQVFAKDANGNLVNGGAPLATAVPDFSGQYTATLSLPSRLRKDVNVLFAREVAVGSLGGTLQINPTTLSGLNGNLAVAGTALRDLAASLNLDPGTLSNLVATINNPALTAALSGTVATAATPITGVGGTITTPAFPIATAGGAGTAGPAVSTLVGGTGTLGAQVGTITGGTAVTPSSIGTLTGGTGTEGARTGSLSNGSGAIDPTTGTLTQAGTAAIAGTGGSSTLMVDEVAVSEPITVLIHQSQSIPGTTLRTRAKIATAREGGARLRPASPAGPQALASRAIQAHPAGRRR